MSVSPGSLTRHAACEQMGTRVFVLCFQLKKDEPKIYSVTVEEELPVRNLKPAVVKVYDYYQTSKSSAHFAYAKTTVEFSECDVCVCFR